MRASTGHPLIPPSRRREISLPQARSPVPRGLNSHHAKEILRDIGAVGALGRFAATGVYRTFAEAAIATKVRFSCCQFSKFADGTCICPPESFNSAT